MGWNRNRLTEKLDIQYPVFQAPMAGGMTTPRLISEVSNSGGLGNMGAGYMNSDEIREDIRKIRSLTDKPFGVNLFVPNLGVSAQNEEISRMEEVLTQYSSELGIKEKLLLPKKDYGTLYEKQLEVVFEESVPVCSFTFGIPDSNVIRELNKQGTIIIGTATNVNEAVEWEDAGADLIVAQGSEAGGHRGTLHKEESGLIGSMALIPQVADAVSKPVVAAGGIMDARGIAAAMMLGAAGFQLGTVFLTCRESGANPIYKNAILNATEEQTVLTKAFSGKLARGISNRFTEEMEGQQLLPYPLQNDMTASLRKQAAKLEHPEFMSLWAGQGVRMAEEITVKELMLKLVKGTEALIDGK
ncbi:nitronate monooxygenase [Bacillus sp. ISL-47]|uniref:NAD(P)H-dependent flavin oxidoreductase n=1 Tax=Bacillus sp. ISL-47 TaxID=2819130 RepID=UPI001BE92220|nr:nitronate monooxygenase [Bacillus sp. ISL-47]MBT2688867.1 nitronate monooxygenase [Bacillus sp. ISL-47]MBT2709109.1 nitronate monooxygenase [Pseudomonas sp. ISL-84]